MDAIQKSKLKMYITVRDYLALFLTILSALPNFTVFYAALQKIIKQIQQADTDQGTKNSGTTTTKKGLAEALISLTFDTSNKIFAYADYLENSVLKEKVIFTESELKRMSPTRLCDTAQGIYDLAETNLTALAPYLVTAATQTALQAAIDALNSFVSKPGIVTGETSLATQQLLDLLKDADTTLGKIDNIVEIIRLTQPDFYFKYKLARKPIAISSSSVSIVGSVTNAATALPLVGALVTFTLNGTGSNGKTTFQKKTAKKGGFRVSNAAAGTYSVTVELPGYKNKETSISVVAGQMSSLKVSLEKA